MNKQGKINWSVLHNPASGPMDAMALSLFINMSVLLILYRDQMQIRDNAMWNVLLFFFSFYFCQSDWVSTVKERVRRAEIPSPLSYLNSAIQSPPFTWVFSSRCMRIFSKWLFCEKGHLQTALGYQISNPLFPGKNTREQKWSFPYENTFEWKEHTGLPGIIWQPLKQYTETVLLILYQQMLWQTRYSWFGSSWSTQRVKDLSLK